jgi:hypothetical protein
MNANKLLIASLLMGGTVSSVFASTINELEVNGSATNNTLSSAQVISGSSFTTNTNPNVFGSLPTVSIQGKGGNGDVDFFSFVTRGGKTYFDIDGALAAFDTILSLFNSKGKLIAFGDDSVPPDPGSASDKDAFLGSIDLPPDTYYIAVSDFGNFPNALSSGTGFSDLFRPDGAIGGTAITGATTGDTTFGTSGTQGGQLYTLHISSAGSGAAKVPLPGSLMLLSIGGVAFLASRKRKYGNYA